MQTVLITKTQKSFQTCFEKFRESEYCSTNNARYLVLNPYYHHYYHHYIYLPLTKAFTKLYAKMLVKVNQRKKVIVYRYKSVTKRVTKSEISQINRKFLGKIPQCQCYCKGLQTLFPQLIP